MDIVIFHRLRQSKLFCGAAPVSGTGMKCSTDPLSYEHFVPTIRTVQTGKGLRSTSQVRYCVLLAELVTKDYSKAVQGTDSHSVSLSLHIERKFAETASLRPRLLSRFYTCVTRKNDSYKAHYNSGESSHKMT